MSLATQMRRAAAGVPVGGDFNPETDITWHSLFWAEGTDFIAEGYSDTDDVDPWPNETGESNATPGVAPNYDAANAAYNDQPTVYFGVDRRLHTGAFSTVPDYTSGVSVVMICNISNVHGYLFDGHDASNQRIIGNGAGSYWVIGAGGWVTGGTCDYNPHLFVAQFDGSTGNDTLDVDGANVIDADAGSSQMTGATLRARRHGVDVGVGDLALCGIYEGDIYADAAWADFVAFCEDHYGLSIA